ncbi:RHS repeat-associated core domain-containing protein [Tenacibaculum sp. 190524A02b]|uniref:DUF6443 domain-containing protein n=1 Tax=Tenacibaculum vairaonense TaxID=3137860 RepID=UPI0032B1B71B
MKRKFINKVKASLVVGCTLLAMGLQAQTQTENYVVSKTYKKARTTKVTGDNKDEVSTTIQYFDGLGRPKQSIALQAGGVLTNANEMPIDWTVNNTATDFYNRNGGSVENKIINGTTPFGSNDLLWECIPNSGDDADGGWNTDYFTIDNTKTYRYTVWVKKNKVGGRAQGRTYHGTRNVNNLNGTANPNPYFLSPFLPKANEWYLLVGIVHPHDYTGGDTGVSGVYDKQGNKVLDGAEYTWRSNVHTTQLRNYLYYCTDTSVRQYFWSPLFQQVDGGDLTVEEIVNSKSAISSLAAPKDIVTHFEYDEFGRQTKEYLPYASATSADIRTGDIATATNAYYQTKHTTDFAGVSLPEVNAYSEKVLEDSPLNRVFEQAAPGKDWKKGSTYSAKGYTNNSHSIKFEYATNSASEVRNYYVTTSFANNTYTPTLRTRTTNNGYYKAGELSKTVTKDENWEATDGNNHTTQEFKNKQGQVVLKRTYNANQAHDTYYVYDDFGNLTYVLPPKVTTNDGVSTSELSELCYQYKYDHRNRLVEKKIAGKGWEYIVYDKLDRPVLTQDANLKSQGKWLFTKYDILGRVVYTGIFKNNNNRIVVQEAANNHNTLFEERGNHLYHYTNNAYPNVIFVNDIYSITYYDNYDYWKHGLVVPSTVQNVTTTNNVKGLVTGTKSKVLIGGEPKWVMTINGYDTKGRTIYVANKNEYLQTTDIVESKLDDFTGKVLETKTTHTKTGKDAIVTVDRFEYDHMDRLVSQTQQINEQISERIVKNNYDELGQLESKQTGNGTRAGYKDVTSGISINKGVISKIGGLGWAVGLATLGSFNQDGYVEFSATQVNKYYMVGLSNANTNAHYNTIKYAIYIRNSNTVHIYEKGKPKGQKTTYKVGDVFRVERIGSEIHYKKNGETFYISQTPSTGSLLGDISMYHTGGKIKDFKIVDNSKGLQKVDYTYNVRGWLKKINEDAVDDNDLFNFSLQYNDVTDQSKRLYNGNIAQTNWLTANDNKLRSYQYGYDALNRITLADYTATGEEHNFSVFNILYDKNGNLTQLKRNYRDAWGHSQLMDDLSYSYDSGNKLQKVTDRAHSSHKAHGFKDGANVDTEYYYDVNGNLKSDINKGINLIDYNHLGLPTRVAKIPNREEIVYVYDATGVKLEKQVVSNNARNVTQYAGDYVYDYFPKVGVTNLEFISHPEGHVKYDGGAFNYVYQYKDHLGNIRLSYTDNNKDGVITPSTEIIEESNYYPFGLKHKGYNNNVSSLGNSTAQKFGYNGIELEESLGLNLMEMDMRSYDPAIARWTSIDPVTHWSNSTYNAFDNNPVFFADPSGADSIYNFETQQYVINGTVVSEEEAIKYAKNGGNADGSNNNKVDDKITLTGDEKLIKRTVDVLNTALNGFYKVSSKKGVLSLQKTNKKGKISKNVSLIAKLLGTIIKDDENITIGVSEKSNQVFIGSYELEEIDISDIEKFGSTSDVQTSGAALLHEFVEQYRKQKLGEEYRSAHSKASKAENLINGSERVQSQMTRNRNGFLVPYRKNGKLKYISIQISNNNIIKVTPK